MKLNLFLTAIVLNISVIAFPGGGSSNWLPSTDKSAGKTFSGTVTKTMSTSEYTYVLVKGPKQTIWAAAPKTTVKVGDKVIFPKGLAMKNFKSKSLKRTFKEVQFTSALIVNGSKKSALATKNNTVVKTSVKKIKKADYTVNGIFKNSKKLSNKNVKVRGQVVKVSKAIMGMNWIHIQDGSGKKGTHDLVVTTNDNASIGDTVLITAKVIVDKDFGYGYAYRVLLQEAKITIE